MAYDNYGNEIYKGYFISPVAQWKRIILDRNRQPITETTTNQKAKKIINELIQKAKQ